MWRTFASDLKHLKMKRIVILTSLFMAVSSLYSQGIVRGKVTDSQTGEELIGAAVIVAGTTKGTATDLDANFSLEGLAAGSYNLVASYITYQSDTIKGVQVKDGEVTIINFGLGTQTIMINQIAVVEAKEDKGRENYMLKMQQKSAGVMDGISSQQIKKAGDSDAAGALSRVTGVSTVGNNIYVRGLSDRYSKTTINGAEIPSIDPNKNSVQMDLFPTTLLDNLIVYKTFSPDLPGDFTGGLVNIVTKDFPEKFNLTYSGSIGYNTNASFNDEFLSSDLSSTDKLGFDNGDRDIPSSAIGQDVPQVYIGNYYDALVYGGYANELAGLNINAPSDITPTGSNSINNVVSQLGISRADADAFLQQIRTNGNTNLSNLTKAFPQTWNNVRRQSSMDMSHSISIGNQLKIGGRDFGYNVAVSYGRSYDYYSDGVTGRYKLTGSFEDVDNLNLEQQFADARGDENNRLSALVNLSYKLNSNNKIAVMYMPIYNGINSSRYQVGINPSDAIGLGQEQRTQRYLERNMNIYQVKGEHFMPDNRNIKLDWTGSYTAGYQNTPDLRVFYNSYESREQQIWFDQNGTNVNDEVEYLLSEGEPVPSNYTQTLVTDTVYSIQDNLYPSPTRFYREMKENNIDLKFNAEMPFENITGISNKVKVGGSFVRRDRELNENRYTFVDENVEYNGNPDEFFVDDNMNIVPGGVNSSYIYLRDDTELQNSYTAEQTVMAAYAMTDWNATSKLRVIAGARVETTDMLLESAKLQDQNLNEEQRNQFRGALDLVDVLPSLNLTYQLQKKDLKVTNLRLAGSRTLARPSFREKAPFATFDFETQYVWIGNPDLDRVLIDNFDIRLEHYPNLGEVISVSGFYKKFNNPIEQVINPTAANVEITWENVNQAEVFGAEFEVKKSLKMISPKLQNFTIGANLTYVVSKTAIAADELAQIRATDPDHKSYRPMFGQSPYIFNGFIGYQNDSLGFEANATFNVSGEKLILVTKGGTPDVYDQPTPTLNIGVSKTLNEKFSLSFKARNILNPVYRQVYQFKGEEYTWQSFTRGRQFSVGVIYKI